MRPQIRFQLQHVDASDVRRAEAFLRIAAERLQCAWSIVEDGDVDVLLTGLNEPDTVSGWMTYADAVLHLYDQADARAGSLRSLTRPLSYEPFVELVRATERPFLERVRPLAEQLRSSASANDRIDAEAPVAARVVLPVVAAESGLGNNAVCRLLKWPPMALLSAHRYHIRLASFLSTRHLDAGALARMSNVEEAQCRAFLHTLHAAGLLDVKQNEAVPKLSSTPSAYPATPAVPATQSETSRAGAGRVGAGVFQMLRRKLGLG